MSPDSNGNHDPLPLLDAPTVLARPSIHRHHASASPLADEDALHLPHAARLDLSSDAADGAFAGHAMMMNAKMLSNHHRVAESTPPSSRTAVPGSRTISSIKEESASPPLSPSLEASFGTPLQSASTESTESVKTVKGTALQTPLASALRTPSYPFPYVPGTPRTWSSSFHRPFTTLSPTVSSEAVRVSETSQDTRSSCPNTPIPSASVFMPPNFAPSDTSQDNIYPPPNLYDLVLTLNLEPGMTSWWSTVTQMFQEFYGADRISLALPADAGEVENVPWGQKATFNQSGVPAPNISLKRHGDSDFSQILGKQGELKQTEPQSSRLNSRRPHLLARHSYAGFERDNVQPAVVQTPGSSTPLRPTALRTKSYAPHASTPTESSLELLLSPNIGTTSERLVSMSDTEFSAVNTETFAGPHSELLQTLRALDYESEALLEATSVNKIIERGRLVVLTRDFSTAGPSRKSSKAGDKYSPPTVTDSTKSSTRAEFSVLYRSAAYEEYEQMPTSPWAQSPAPSPAVQTDTDENPFFSETNVDEESFKPPEKPVDYSHSGAVEAIGIDKASTVIHIPLIHPRYPSNFPFRFKGATTAASKSSRTTDRLNEGRSSPLKRAPIAILSFSAPEVPYPQDHIQSLQLLAPHLATTLEMAQHYTNMQQQLSYRQSRGLGFADRRDTLGDLADADIDISNDSTGLTSPSDYSGRSRQSPGGSVGTPGWDHGHSGFTSHGVASTPGQMSAAEMVDSYFDAKNKVIQPTVQSSNTLAQSRVPESPSREPDSSPRKVNSEERGTASRRSGIKPPIAEPNSRKPHAFLHSYGADINSTFNTLPALASPLAPGLSKLPNTGSIIPSTDQREMPPPSERLLRTIVDSLPVQIFTASPGSGEISWVNSKFIVYRGQEASSQIINDPWKAIHPDDRPEYLDEWQRSLDTGQPFLHKVRLQRFDSAYRWFYVRATPLRDKRQKIVHWAGTCMDIHEQHIAEVNAARQQETAASEVKYRSLANSSPQIVFAITRSRGVIFCNSQWLTYSGQTEEEAMGIGFTDFVHPEDIAKCRLPTLNPDGTLEVDAPTSISPSGSPTSSNSISEHSSESSKTVTSPGFNPTEARQISPSKLYKLATTGILKLSRDQDGRPSYSTEVRLRSKEGAYRWHLVRVLLSESIHKDNSDEETWYGTCTDINDHKILEQTLKDTMDAKSRFLSNMSHEMRTPLNGILGMVNFLIDTSLSTEQMEHVNIIRNSTEGLRDLINDILDLSKVEAGMITLNLEWMHVRSLIEEVNDIMFALAVDKGLELNYVVEPEVPSMVKGDRFRIRQVLLNVVGNAIKFTQKGEVFVKCNLDKSPKVDLAANELCLQFQVMDTGKGFNDKEAEFLFKRFSQIDSSGSKTGNGTGLGLAISMQLVELHGGMMRASGQPGKGSTFTFTVKCNMPSNQDRPLITATSSDESIHLETAGAIIPTPQPLTETSQGIRFPRVTSQELMSSPSPTGNTPSPKLHHTGSTASSGGSERSLRTAESSIRSQRSSVSSAEMSIPSARSPPIALEMPARIREHNLAPLAVASQVGSDDSVQTVRPASAEPKTSPAVPTARSPLTKLPYQPPHLYSILVICPLDHTREAVVKHIELTLPKMAPSHITARSSVADCNDLLAGQDNPVRFSHVVIDLPLVSELIPLLDHLLATPALANTCAVIVTDVKQRREINAAAPHLDFERLNDARRVLFLFKPLKPSKIAVVFDPQKISEVATDRNQNSAQAVAMTQKMIFDDLRKRLGDQKLHVLLVEDNKTSQMVLSRFLGRIGVGVDVVGDGAEGTKKVFETAEKAQKEEGKMYDLVFCDLYMPIKDGYRTCKEIRRWERSTQRSHMPIIALSANVLGDVYAKCVEAGFNSYVTKPVDFNELRDVLVKYLDPPGGRGTTKLEFMKMK